MKAPLFLPKNLRLIDRESFLASAEKRGHTLLRARLDNPGNHLLVLFCDAAEKYAVLVDVGPAAHTPDLKQAIAAAPEGLAAHYIIPCAQCPPYAIPKGLPTTTLPNSLAPLTPPPAGFTGETKSAQEAAPPPTPAPAPTPSGMQFNSQRAAAKPPIPSVAPRPTLHAAPPVAKPEPVAPTTTEPSTSALPDAGSLAALLARSLQDIEKNLAAREADVASREAELVTRESAVAAEEQSTQREREELRQEALRIGSEIEAREADLSRREAELKSRADAIVRTLRDIEEARLKIEALSGHHGGASR